DRHFVSSFQGPDMQRQPVGAQRRRTLLHGLPKEGEIVDDLATIASGHSTFFHICRTLCLERHILAKFKMPQMQTNGRILYDRDVRHERIPVEPHTLEWNKRISQRSDQPSAAKED